MIPEFIRSFAVFSDYMKTLTMMLGTYPAAGAAIAEELLRAVYYLNMLVHDSIDQHQSCLIR